jgi:hypothetical protein
VAGWFYCALIASLKEGEARETRAMAGGALRLRARERKGGRLEVGGDPDSWARPVSGQAKKRTGERLLGCGGPQVGCEGRRGQMA